MKLITKKIKTCFIFLFSFLFLGLFIPICKSDEPYTVVSIDPSSKTVATLESFTINVSCIPGVPIKAFEFKLSFNASLLQASSVTEGDIFEGYNTFFNSGTINNINGTIINVYGLIIGEGNVSNPGTLAVISFDATSNTGTSNLTLYDTGITNETDYLPILTNNGSVTIEGPYFLHVFSNETPLNNSINIPTNTPFLSINIEDIQGNPFYWEITTSPFIGNYTGDNESNGTKTCNITGLNYKTTYIWYVNCMDLVTFEWTNKTYRFTTKAGSSGGGGYIPPQAPNNPPNKPLTPNGSIFIEKEVLYEYLSSSFDIDNNTIRYMFDWGDGFYSPWSEYLESNATISMNHSWDNLSTFEIRVIAQDVNGLNSSWSEALEVIVSEVNNSEEEPDIIIDIVNDFNVSNKTFIFDASKSIIFNGVIINYTWDFGDGEFGYGAIVVHTFNFSKEYNVSLIVTNNYGNTYFKNITLNVLGESGSNVTNEIDESQGLGITGIIIIISVLISIIVILLIIFREKIQTKILNHQIYKIWKSENHKK